MPYRKIDPNVQKRVLADYASGIAVETIARTHNVSRASVDRWAHAAGLFRRQAKVQP